jgi:hypothetical protein
MTYASRIITGPDFSEEIIGFVRDGRMMEFSTHNCLWCSQSQAAGFKL